MTTRIVEKDARSAPLRRIAAARIVVMLLKNEIKSARATERRGDKKK